MLNLYLLNEISVILKISVSFINFHDSERKYYNRIKLHIKIFTDEYQLGTLKNGSNVFT